MSRAIPRSWCSSRGTSHGADTEIPPVAAAGRVYVTGREGATLVFDHTADPPEFLALNRLEDSFSASAAIVEGEIYLRGERYVYCIAHR